jgi:integrase
VHGCFGHGHPSSSKKTRPLFRDPREILSGGWASDSNGTVASYVNPNAHCPVCGETIYFYRSPYPHMLRHACGYALANKGHDTRALQAYLGHKNIQHTVRYTELSPARFKDFWRK